METGKDLGIEIWREEEEGLVLEREWLFNIMTFQSTSHYLKNRTFLTLKQSLILTPCLSCFPSSIHFFYIIIHFHKRRSFMCSLLSLSLSFPFHFKFRCRLFLVPCICNISFFFLFSFLFFPLRTKKKMYFFHLKGWLQLDLQYGYFFFFFYFFYFLVNFFYCQNLIIYANFHTP